MVKFDTLWDNHPTVDSILDDVPCKTNGSRAFDNQCAIRLGVSLEKSGVDTRSFKGVRCWHNHGTGHILRAEELANWFKSSLSPFRMSENFKGSGWF